MSGPWDRAVADAAEDIPSLPFGRKGNAFTFALLKVVQRELECLWSDLDNAIDMTLRTPGNPDGAKWSMGANDFATRIVILSRVAGATDWMAVPTTRVLDGTYAGLLDAAGITRDGPTDDDLRALRQWQSRARM